MTALLAYTAFAIGVISASIFCCHALAFSTGAARRAYRAGERWVNAVLAGVFAYAGVRMLLAR